MNNGAAEMFGDEPALAAVVVLSWKDRMTICARRELSAARKAAAERWGVPESAIIVTAAAVPLGE